MAKTKSGKKAPKNIKVTSKTAKNVKGGVKIDFGR